MDSSELTRRLRSRLAYDAVKQDKPRTPDTAQEGVTIAALVGKSVLIEIGCCPAPAPAPAPAPGPG